MLLQIHVKYKFLFHFLQFLVFLRERNYGCNRINHATLNTYLIERLR